MSEQKVYISKDGRTRELTGRKGVNRLHWNSAMINKLHDLFPVMKTEDLAIDLGVSPRTVVRKARELGISKDPQWLSDVWEENRRLAQTINRIHPNKGSENFVKLGAAHRFKPGHPPVQLSEEAKLRLHRRKAAIIRENTRRRKKGLPKLTQKEKEQWYRLMNI